MNQSMNWETSCWFSREKKSSSPSSSQRKNAVAYDSLIHFNDLNTHNWWQVCSNVLWSWWCWFCLSERIAKNNCTFRDHLLCLKFTLGRSFGQESMFANIKYVLRLLDYLNRMFDSMDIATINWYLFTANAEILFALAKQTNKTILFTCWSRICQWRTLEMACI